MEPATYIPKTPASPASGPSFSEKLRHFSQNLLRFFQKVGKSLAKALKKFAAMVRRGWKKFLRRFTKWIDPKLEPYRTHPLSKPISSPDRSSDLDALKAPSFQPREAQSAELRPAETLSDIPKTRADLIEIISQAPHSIFSQRERTAITNLLELPVAKASEIMLPAAKIVYVDAAEVLGPLTLDRLYRTGLSHFPVKNAAGDLIGCVHTTHFNNLDIRQSSRVSDILDPGLYFIREDYTLEQTLNAFLRTNAFFFLVTDRYGKIVGLVSFNDFIRHLFGSNPKDTFDADTDRLAVASRKA